jgi:hypothetical protein
MQKIIERFVQRRTRVNDNDDVTDEKKKKNSEVLKAVTTIERECVSVSLQ